VNADIAGQIDTAVMNIAERALKSRAEKLKQQILYEIAVSNTELQFEGATERYKIKHLSGDYAAAISISPMMMEGGNVKMQLSIDPDSINNLSQSELDFFKKYVLTNALKTMKGGEA
jgi:uncharacterized protein YpmS